MQRMKACLQVLMASGFGFILASSITFRSIVQQFAHARLPIGRDPALIWAHWKQMGIVQ